MGIETEIKEAEARLAELDREITRPAGNHRNMKTIIAEMNGARRDVALARAWLGSRAEPADPDAAETEEFT